MEMDGLRDKLLQGVALQVCLSNWLAPTRREMHGTKTAQETAKASGFRWLPTTEAIVTRL